jgi:hypothetical protein
VQSKQPRINMLMQPTHTLMKRALFLSLIVFAATQLAQAQGTVMFSNGYFSKVSVSYYGTYDSPVSTEPGQYTFGLFYGIGQSTSLTFLSNQLGVNSTTQAGIIARATDGYSLMNTVQLPGTTAGESDVWIQVKGWDSSFGSDWAAAEADFHQEEQSGWGVTPHAFGETDICNVISLGPTAGPGVAIWEGASGTNPHLLNALTLVIPIPEPGVLPLGIGGVLFLLLLRLRHAAGSNNRQLSQAARD